MTRNRMLNMSERWFRFLQRLYPPDFRDEMGNAVVEATTPGPQVRPERQPAYRP